MIVYNVFNIEELKRLETEKTAKSIQIELFVFEKQ